MAMEAIRVGMIVELQSLPTPADGSVDLNGQLGKVISHAEDGRIQVALINGRTATAVRANVRVPSDLQRPGMGGSSSSFDLLIGSRPDAELLGDEISACLFEKGFCVMKICQDADEVRVSLAAMREAAEAGKLQRLAEEVEDGYLGVGNKGKVAWLDPADEQAPRDKLLQKNDDFLSTLASVLQPYCPDILGKTIEERTPALASLSLTDEEEIDYPPQESDDATLGQFLNVWRRRLLHVVHFMGPENATVVLQTTDEDEATSLPVPQDSVEIEAGPNTIIIFRPSVFKYECTCDEENLSLSAMFLQKTEKLSLLDWEGDTDFLFAGDGPPCPQVDQLEVVNMACRMMCNWDENEAYRAGLYGGCDAGVEIPFTRWNVDEYYNPDFDSLQNWQAPTKHQSMVEGVELFDAKYFEIPVKDVRNMDPMQRMVLDCGAKNLYMMGITKKVSNRTPRHGGVSVGLDKDDWDRLAKCPEASGGTNVQAIISNRFSFVFNLRGPNYVADTACSASLCATHLAKFTLLDRSIDQLEFHIAMGLHLCLHPSYFLGGKSNTMNSAIGRCLTFNASASGYMRGDGCSGITLKYGKHEERDAVWRASMINQNGRSATLTAPNGMAQGDIIEKAYREAKIKAPESVIWSCHGTGTSLGDPIEVGAIRRAQIKVERESPLVILTNKTHCGHLEGGAAMTSLIAACLMCKSLNSVPILHFRQLNPNLEQSTFTSFYNNEMSSTNYTCGNVHVSSFGFGGSNGHAILWGQSLYGIPDVPAAFAKRLRKMLPPEVRVSGSDPNEWEWDGPEQDVKEGDLYTIKLHGDASDVPIVWDKIRDANELNDGLNDYYCITGPFNDWDSDRMEDGPISGMRTITLEMPASGEIEFRFLKNGEEDGVIFPVTDKCTWRGAEILGPDLKRDDKDRTRTTWLITGEPSELVRIDFFSYRGRQSVMWTFLGSQE